MSNFLCVLGEKFKAVLLRMSQLASSGATELRVRSLDAISQLLTLQVCVCSHQTTSITFVHLNIFDWSTMVFAARAADRRPFGPDRVLVPPFV